MLPWFPERGMRCCVAEDALGNAFSVTYATSPILIGAVSPRGVCRRKAEAIKGSSISINF